MDQRIGHSERVGTIFMCGFNVFECSKNLIEFLYKIFNRRIR